VENDILHSATQRHMGEVILSDLESALRGKIGKKWGSKKGAVVFPGWRSSRSENIMVRNSEINYLPFGELKGGKCSHKKSQYENS